MKTAGKLSIAEAARLLSARGDAVDRSTLSRYLKQHAEALPVERAGKVGLVDFEQLAAHRSENIRLTSRPITVDRKPAPSATDSAPRPTQIAGNARKANAEAELKEMELAERRRELTPTAEVDQAGRDAIALMVSAFERSIETTAANLAVRHGWDERKVRLALKEFARGGTDTFHRNMLARLDAIRRGDAGSQAVDDRDAAAVGLQ